MPGGRAGSEGMTGNAGPGRLDISEQLPTASGEELDRTAVVAPGPSAPPRVLPSPLATSADVGRATVADLADGPSAGGVAERPVTPPSLGGTAPRAGAGA